MRYSYKTNGTCSRQIDFDLEGNVVHNVTFHGGCNGNLQAISKVVEGAAKQNSRPCWCTG